MSTTATTSALVVLSIALASGCGGSSSGAGSPPEALMGTYATTLQAGDVAGNHEPVLSDRLELRQEECAAESGGYTFHDNEYAWSLEGDTLTIAAVSNACPDRVAETILTSRPWTRTG
jgi:hypothetical protein